MNERTLYIWLLALLMTGTAYGQRAEHLSQQVNSEYEEREPILSPDGKTLYFWRRSTPANTAGLPDPGDIWVSRLLGDGSWTSAVRVGPPLNTDGHDFVWHVGQDTLWINQVAPGGREAGMKYSVKNRNGFWGRPQPAYIRGFVYEGNYKDFFMGPGRVMLLPNEGKDSYGETDIYVCFPINDTAWSKPLNLGPVINTAGDDDAPFLAPDGVTLYFNSNGHGGFGDHDVFVSTRLDDSWQNWSEPVNLGHPINTPGYDFDFVITADGSYAYWGSESGSYGNNDIFRLPLKSCELDVYPEGNHTVCRGETFVLEAGFTDESDVTFQWKKDGNIIPGATGRRLNITEPGSYSLVKVRNKCVVESPPQRIRFIDPPLAEIKSYSEIICLDDSIRLRTTSQNGVTYQWQRNGLDIPGANRAIYWVKTPGTYSVKVANSSCESVSEPIELKRFQPPVVFRASDTLLQSPLIIPQWVWTNKLEARKGTQYLKDLAVSPEGSAVVLSLVADQRGRITEYIARYFPEGPYRFELPARKVDDLSPRFLDVDAEGNIIVTRNEIYLSKYRPDGKLLWRIDQSIDKVCGVATDEIGNIYTLGRYRDTIRFEGRAYPATKRGSMFLAKHSPSGDLQWVRTMSVDWYKYDFGNALQTDCQGNVYLAGGYSSIANFREKILRGGLRGYSYFVAKYNANGDFQWANKVSTDKMGVRTHDIYTDCQGNTYLLFNYLIQKYDKGGKLLFEKHLKAPGAPRNARIAANQVGDLFLVGITQDKGEFFVTKLDHKGNQVMLWMGKGGSDATEDLPLIDSDASGNIYVAGISKSGDAPPGTMLATRRKSDAFIAKYGKIKPKLVPEAITICPGEPVRLMTREEKGVSYQWLRNGEPIPGAITASLLVQEAGDYQLLAIAAPCQRTSPVQKVMVDCGNKPPALPPPPPPRVNTPPVAASSRPSELRRDANGRPVRLRNRRIKPQDDILISNPKVTISLWDHGADDQDTISLNINGVWVLQNYRLRKEKKEIEFTFDPAEPYNVIILYAHNLGRVPPNTASIMIDDGINQQTTRLRSNLNSNGSINVQLAGSRGRWRK